MATALVCIIFLMGCILGAIIGHQFGHDSGYRQGYWVGYRRTFDEDKFE